MGTNTSPMKRLASGQGKHTDKFGLVKPDDSLEIRNWKILGVWLLVIAFTWPVFRSGGRSGLTMFDWIREHSIWGSPVQYVPAEDYMAELSK